MFGFSAKDLLSPKSPQIIYDDYKEHNKGPDPAKDAREMEDARQARIKAAVDMINGVFDTPERGQLYDTQKQAVFDINKRDIDKQYSDAEKQVRFGLARNGLLGGSEDVDANAKLQTTNNEGLIKAGGIADQSAADLKVADERTRQSLLTMAQSGIDTGTAQQSALRGLDATAQTAAANRAGATIGDLFGNLGKAYATNQTVAGLRSGLAGNGTQQTGVVASPYRTYAGT